MPEERRRRNLLYPLSKEGYSNWLTGNINRSKTKVKYAKELGLNLPAQFHSKQIKISEGRLANLAKSKSLGKMKKPAYVFKLVSGNK
jgi:hypothetical protein